MESEYNENTKYFYCTDESDLEPKKYSPLGSLDQLMGCGKNMNVVGLLSPGIRVWGRSGEIKVNM